jgi:hypothetical protein
MENDPTIEFDYFLADRLKCTVAQLHQMDHAEYVGWCVYYGRKAQREQIATAKR